MLGNVSMAPKGKISIKRTALIEVVVFFAIVLASKEIADPFLGPYSGPATLVATLVLLTVYLSMRGENWASLGLRGLPGTKAKLLIVPQVILVFFAVLTTITLLTKGLEAIGLPFMSEPIEGEKERWGDVEGNLRMYLILIGLSWISAGFGEEMFFRGFVITRLQITFRGFKLASVYAVVLSALIFGYVHFYYQGLAGFVNATVIGLIFGAAFLLYKRNLWPLIFAHGFINSLGFTAEFMGWNL